MQTETSRSACGACTRSQSIECRVRGTGALAAGDEEGVGRFGVGEAAVRYERESDARADRRAVERGGAEVVRDVREARGPREDLHGPGHIEALDAVEEDDEYGSLLSCPPSLWAAEMAAMTNNPPFLPSGIRCGPDVALGFRHVPTSR